MKFIIFTLALLWQLQASVIAQEVNLPRLLELNDKLTRDASSYIKSRFPDHPHLVNVKIIPLRRGAYASSENFDDRSDRSDHGESLPFFAADREEIIDEWDDPGYPLVGLIARSKQITITISLPDSINDSEVAELKDALYGSLHIIPARDEIIILRKIWNTEGLMWENLLLVLPLIILFLIGSFLINNRLSSKIAKAFASSRAASLQTPSSSQDFVAKQAQNSEKLSSAPSFSEDLVKLTKMAADLIKPLLDSKKFPTLQDMIELDNLATSNPEQLGAILQEFTSEMRTRLLSLSFRPGWPMAILNSASLDSRGVMILGKLNRFPRENVNLVWETMLIAIWRMESSDQIGFLKRLDRKEALSILGSFPKDLALPIAKAAFPGGWGPILDVDNHYEEIPSARINTLTDEVLRIRPLQDSGIIKRYKFEKEILNFLKIAAIHEETEIYHAIPNESKLHELRPPFYKVFQASDEMLREFSELIPLDRWIQALHEASADYRDKIVKHFSEKKRFLFEERSKSISIKISDRELIGMVREGIARQFVDFEKNHPIQQQQVTQKEAVING